MFLPLLDYLAESYGPFRVFNYLTFRAILSTLTARVFCLLFGHPIINYLKKQSYGQVIRSFGPETHLEKSGTPTMGGILILGAIIFSLSLIHI